MEWLFILASVVASFLVVIFFILIGKLVNVVFHSELWKTHAMPISNNAIVRPLRDVLTKH